MKWTGVVACGLGLANAAQAFVVPATFEVSSSTAHSRGCSCPCCAGSALRTAPLSGAKHVGRSSSLVVLQARRRGGRGGGWTGRRRKDAPPVEFDKFGLPIPPKKSQKELEEAHQKWMESLAPEGGFDTFDPAEVGMRPQDLHSDPFLEEPSAETEVDAEGDDDQRPDWDNLPEYAGEFVGADDPLDAPWRLKAQDIISQVVTDAGLKLYDMTWHMHQLNIDVTNEDESLGSPTSDQVAELSKAIEEALLPHEQELQVMQRFDLVIGTPGAKDVLTTDREFKAFRGFEVIVKLKSPISESEKQNVRIGRLMERNPMFTIINVKGKNVSINTEFVSEVRLPEAKHEDDDVMAMDDDWGSLFADGVVPADLACEYEMPGLVSFDDKDVRMVEPQYYVPPNEDDLGDNDEEEETFDIDALDEELED